MATVEQRKKDSLGKHLLIGFLIALAGYVIFFSLDRFTRTRKGPWEVSFGTNESGYASLIVNQPSLNISNVHLVFVEERLSNSPGVVQFERPLQSIPFGKTKFEDLTYLPGSVVFDFFGHEVELLPRTMYVNRKERGWSNGSTHLLTPGEKLPASALVEGGKKRKRRR